MLSAHQALKVAVSVLLKANEWIVFQCNGVHELEMVWLFAVTESDWKSCNTT